MSELDHKEGWTLKNWCFQTVLLEEILECPLDSKEIKPVNLKGNQSLSIHLKDWCCTWSYNTLATWCEEPTHWKRPWRRERLRAGEEVGREWHDWMASLTQWTWVWANSGREWRTGKAGLLQSMGSHSQRWLSNWSKATVFLTITFNCVFPSKCLQI